MKSFRVLWINNSEYRCDIFQGNKVNFGEWLVITDDSGFAPKIIIGIPRERVFKIEEVTP